MLNVLYTQYSGRSDIRTSRNYKRAAEPFQFSLFEKPLKQILVVSKVFAVWELSAIGQFVWGLNWSIIIHKRSL